MTNFCNYCWGVESDPKPGLTVHHNPGCIDATCPLCGREPHPAVPLTAVELEALPVGTGVRSESGTLWRKLPTGEWATVDELWAARSATPTLAVRSPLLVNRTNHDYRCPVAGWQREAPAFSTRPGDMAGYVIRCLANMIDEAGMIDQWWDIDHTRPGTCGKVYRVGCRPVDAHVHSASDDGLNIVVYWLATMLPMTRSALGTWRTDDGKIVFSVM